MSIEIDILNGDASWTRVEPLMDAVWPPHVVEKLPWGHIKWAHADLRVLIDTPEDSPRGGLACHVGIYFRTVSWNGRKVHVGGIGGVATREDCRAAAMPASRSTLRSRPCATTRLVRFAMLFCEPHNFAFYQARGWHPFNGEIYCRAAGGTHSLRGDGAVRVRHHPARRATAPSTYAACRGDPCMAMGGLRAGRVHNMLVIIYSVQAEAKLF